MVWELLMAFWYLIFSYSTSKYKELLHSLMLINYSSPHIPAVDNSKFFLMPPQPLNSYKPTEVLLEINFQIWLVTWGKMTQVAI